MKQFAGLVGLSLAVLVVNPASADISREAKGKYTVTSITVTDGENRVLAIINADSAVPMTADYSFAVGTYGGGDTASGRRTAKARAITKAFNCNWEFYVDGRSSEWGPKCTTNGVTYDTRWSDAWNFGELLHQWFCGRARLIAAQTGVSGPVYIAGNVGFFGDASGTESDYRDSFGSFAYIPCY